MRLAAIPDKDDLLSLLEERAAARSRVESAIAGLAKAEGDYQVAQRRADTLAQQLDRVLEEKAQAVLGSEDSQRLVQHATQARDTLARFRSSLLERHAEHIQQVILESFLTIVRKQDLISGIRIDPATSDLNLLGKDGDLLLPERLSAGERQLMAVSILWGLARAAGRPLPAVIDTPLGRLDSTHRLRLVKDYFPRASHQVILLSTDEEIDETLFLALRPHIARSYVLCYDPEASSSRDSSPAISGVELVMSLEHIRLSQQAKDQLVRLKRRTGLQHWNELCRWAFCLSVAEPSIPAGARAPTDSNVEMTWKVFAGQHATAYLTLLRHRCKIDGRGLHDEDLAETLTLHIHRGIGYLAADRNVRSIAALLHHCLGADERGVGRVPRSGRSSPSLMTAIEVTVDEATAQTA